jgi:hypothetical protein
MRNLSEVLSAILVSSLAACSGTTVASVGDGGVPGVPPTKETDTVTCLSPYTDMAGLYAQLTLAPGVDGIAFYAMQPYGRVDPDGGASPLLDRGRLGKPCTVGSTCEADLAALANATAASFKVPNPGAFTGWDEGQAGQIQVARGFAIVARAGVLSAVRSLSELQVLIAPIESLNEAQAWASIQSQGASCESTPNASQASADYYELRSIQTTCTFGPTGSAGSFDVTSEIVVRVYRDGRIEAQAPRELRRVPTSACPVAGRKPAGLLEEDACSHASSPLGNYLAEIAHLEAAAVFAFGELASELARFGAPTSLIERARKAEADEVRHAQTMSQYAMAFGATPKPAVSSATKYASLFDLALHNAEEGCVRETYGALVAMHQSVRASDAAFRIDLAIIASDEVQHATWSHDLDQWLSTQLTKSENHAVAEAKAKAFERLERECSAEAPNVTLEAEAGLPDAATSAHMLAALKRAPFSATASAR